MGFISLLAVCGTVIIVVNRICNIYPKSTTADQTLSLVRYIRDYYLTKILTNQTKMSESLDALNAKVDALQASLDSVQEAVKSTITALQSQIDELNGKLATGATAEEIQAVIAKLDSTKTDLEGTLS